MNPIKTWVFSGKLKGDLKMLESGCSSHHRRHHLLLPTSCSPLIGVDGSNHLCLLNFLLETNLYFDKAMSSFVLLGADGSKSSSSKLLA